MDLIVKPPSVLVVEDNDEDYSMIRHGFAGAGLADRLERARDAGEARLRMSRAEDTPCLILLDLNMPGEDGHQLLRHVKSDARLHPVPVVMLSTSASPRDVQACYEGGANSYHAKPLETPKFHALIRQLAGYWLKSVHLAGAVR